MATILIVDDHVLNREFLLTLLSYGGHQLFDAADGVEGLKLVRDKHPDLIIADILMPNMNGYEFVTQLHADPTTAVIPVIFYTAAFRENEAKVMAATCGVRWVLPKPSEPETILQTVHEALKLPPGTSAPAATLRAPPLSQQRLSTIDRQLTGYLEEIETSSDLLSEILHDGVTSKRQDPEHLTQNLSKSLSSLQAVSLRLTALIEVGIELAAERDATRLIEVACRAAQGICVAKCAVIGVLDDEGKRLSRLITLGFDDKTRDKFDRLAPAIGLVHRLIKQPSPHRLANANGKPRDIGLPGWHPPVHSLLSVTIASRERTYGCLYLADKLGADEFNEIDERTAVTIAAQLAVAYENLELFEKSRQQHEQLCSEMEERKKYQTRIEYLANHDPLTNLANRNLLGDRLKQAMLQTQRLGGVLALLLLDLDRFKEVNDSFGHDFGDTLLKAMAERLGTIVRAGDTVARQGGDEFIILLTNLKDVQDVLHTVDKIIHVFSRPFLIENHPLYMTASIGATVYPDDSEDLQTLLQNADTAMYRAKAEQTSSFRFYSPDMSMRAQERIALEHALRLAIEREEFELYYQPKVSLDDGRICGSEALIRWHHPDHGMISPLSFIPLAEETGLIVQIGEWVFRSACIQNKAWQAAGLPPVSVAINLSARQFRHAELVRSLSNALHDSGLDAQYLELELTESLVMNSAELFITKLRNLKDLGIRLSIDDFGTGYSSLSYLKRFPIDSLKIDQSFVRDIATDPDDAAITRSVISLGHSLNLTVIAEGVETEAQRTFLHDHRCDQMQGFYFSEPVPAQDFALVLRQH